MPSKTASGVKYPSPRSAKRAGHSSSPVMGSSQQVSSVACNNSPTKNIASTAVSNNTNIISNNNTRTTTSFTSTSPAKNNMKIIVNQFHASSLLNGHGYEEKEQILTQNGLTNPQSASAYEASYYAANYLTPDARNNNSNNSQMHGMIRSNLEDHSNYVGVSLANNGNSEAAHLNSNGLADDDPCGGKYLKKDTLSY